LLNLSLESRESWQLPPSPIASLNTVELSLAHEAQLQRFFEANPDYFLAVHGEPARPGEAREQIQDEPPPGWTFARRCLIGYQDSTKSLVAVAEIISDLLVPSVWHIGLFIVATSCHGTGTAQALYQGLEAWAAASGAKWLRLGVVQGHTRAERFWKSMAFIQTRTRSGVPAGKRVNTLRVMFKPLAGGTLEQYLAIIERDRPEPS
jgi:GNAT superfamily N-acetyltransferase